MTSQTIDRTAHLLSTRLLPHNQYNLRNRKSFYASKWFDSSCDSPGLVSYRAALKNIGYRSELVTKSEVANLYKACPSFELLDQASPHHTYKLKAFFVLSGKIHENFSLCRMSRARNFHLAAINWANGTIA